jgi:hypothetical protein
MTFNEAETNRDQTGRFAEKVGGSPEVSLDEDKTANFAGRYFDDHIRGTYGDIPSDHIEKLREQYVGDILGNPEAARQLDAIYVADSGFTDANGLPVPKPLKNPFRKGQRVVIPAGTVVRFKGEEILTERKQTVTVHMSGNGYYDEVRTVDGWGNFKLRKPTVTWAGAGGYWKDAQVDLDVLEANDKTPEYDEEAVGHWKHQLGRKNFLG